MRGLPLTGERTVPGIAEEAYWFARHEAVYRWLAREMAGTPGPRIDIGSGEGYGAVILGAGALIVGVELDAAAAAHAARTYPQVATVRANAVALPFADGAFALAASLQVIEHVWNVPAYLAEIRRITRGTIAIATPNRPVFSPGLARGARPVNPFHEREFDADELHEALEDAGFEEVRILGLQHDERLAAWPDLVEAQIAASLAGEWGAELAAFVASVTWQDFAIGAPEGAQDLIAIGRSA